MKDIQNLWLFWATAFWALGCSRARLFPKSLPGLRSSPGPIASSSKPHGRAQDTRPEQLLSADGHLQRCLGRTRLDHNTNVLYADTLATHVNLWAGRSYMTLGREQGGMKYGFRLWCTEAWGIGQDGWFYAFGSSLGCSRRCVDVPLRGPLAWFLFDVLVA